MKFELLFLILFCGATSFAGDAFQNEPIRPLPTEVQMDTNKVLLGRRLFEDKNLSRNNTISCSSCHNLSLGGGDSRAKSLGINSALGEINAPTVFNARYNFRQFWNGRAKNLKEQIDGPIQHPQEMGSQWNQVVEKLKADANYTRLFKRSYRDGISIQNIKDAIATFEKELTTPNSKFDKYLQGNTSILNEKERLGYLRFKSYGCIACHQGVNVGGNMFQTMGVMGDYFKDRGGIQTEADLGLFAVTKKPSDKNVFKVPSLRNIELTSPYFHDGSAKTLEEATGVMAKYQLGRKLSKEDVDSIVSFLKTLTGDRPAILNTPLPRLGDK